MKTESTSKNSRRARSGSAILLSLIVLSMVTFGLAAWASLLTSRTYFVETMENSIQRRIAHGNSVHLAKEYIYTNALTKTSGSDVHLELDGGMGGIHVGAWTGGVCDLNPDGTYSQPGAYSRLSPAEGLGFNKDLSISLSDGTETHERVFRMRSRSPMLSGQLLTLTQPWYNTSSTQINGNFRVNGLSLIWRPQDVVDSGFDYTRTLSDIYVTPTVGASAFVMKNTGGTDIPVSNFPSVPITTGEFVDRSGNLQMGYDGKSSPVENAQTLSNSLAQKVADFGGVFVNGSLYHNERGVESDGSGEIEIDLSDPLLSTVHIYNHVDRITFRGQSNSSEEEDAEALNAVLVVFVQDDGSSRTIDDIRLEGSNHRQLVFATKVTDSSDDWAELRFRDADEDPLWRMILINENTRMRFRFDGRGTVTMKGGIQADRRLRMETNGNEVLEIVREENPSNLLEQLAGRQMWLEDYHTDTVLAGTSDPFNSYNSPYSGPGGVYDTGSSGGGTTGGGEGGTTGSGGGDADTTRPSVVLTTPETNVSGSFEVTATFSEDVTGVGDTDFLVDNGTATNVAGSGSTYTVTITPTNLGPVSLFVAENTSADPATNGNIASNTLNITFSGPLTIVNSNFDAGPDGWVYEDNAFRGASNGYYASGSYLSSGGQSGGGLRVYLGGLDGADIYGMSGAYAYSFDLDVESDVTVDFSYRFTYPSAYDWNENGEVLISIDDALIYSGANDYLLRYLGGYYTNYDSGWVTVSVPLGTLSAASHTVRIGGYNNKKTYSNESMEILIDNVSIDASYP